MKIVKCRTAAWRIHAVKKDWRMHACLFFVIVNFKIPESNLQSQNIILLNNLIGIQIPLVPLCRLFNNQIRYVFLMSYLVPLMLIQLETTFQDHRFFLRWDFSIATGNYGKFVLRTGTCFYNRGIFNKILNLFIYSWTKEPGWLKLL